jgi:hypothetical protein
MNGAELLGAASFGGREPFRAAAADPRPSDRSFLAELVRALLAHERGTLGRLGSRVLSHAALSTTVLPAVPAPLTSSPPPAVALPQDTAGSDAPAPSDPGLARAASSISLPALPDPLQAVTPSRIISGLEDLVAQRSTSGPWRLEDYPRPVGDTGRGFHWIPTLHSDPAVVDRFVSEAKKMGASWMVILNDGTQIGDNDYLVRRLVANQIEPVMRIYTPHGSTITGDLTAMVRHYASLGVHYFQPYNEPNLPDENPDGQVSVASYVDRWIAAARAILAGGGLPGLGALAPGAPVDDVAFLRSTLDEIRRRGATDLLNHAWISVHNYTFNRPISYQDDSNGFLKFRWYDQVARDELGRSLPIISTEGGPRLGDHVDPRYPVVDEARRDAIATAAFDYLSHREPYFFAHTQWVLANEAGGGHDRAWSADALYRPDGSPTPLASMLQAQEVDA